MFADITNGFPSTEQSALSGCLKLQNLGAEGMIFNWIEWIYERMK